MKHKGIVIVSFSIIVILAIYLLIIWYYNPKRIFQRKFEIDLPKTSSLVNHKYDFWEDRLFLKISLDENDFKYIEGELENRFKYLLTDNSNSQVSNYNFLYSWWDINRDEIITSYQYLVSGTNRGIYKAKSKDVSIVITSENGEYFLYIVH